MNGGVRPPGLPQWPTFARVLNGWFLVLMLAASAAYGVLFATELHTYEPDEGIFQYALNAHDHWVYRVKVDIIRYEGARYELTNDLGIAIVYTALAALLPFAVDEQYVLIALLFNCVVLASAWHIYSKICEKLAFEPGASLTFFANLSLLYFAQLINKDMLTIWFFLFAIRAGLENRLMPLLLLLPVAALVRQQLALCLAMYIFLLWVRRPLPWVLVFYALTSILAAFLSVYFPVVGEETLGEGLSSFAVRVNQDYFFSGYLLLNPLRVAQYVHDAYLSFDVLTDTGGLEVAKLLRWPQLLLVALLSPYFIGAIWRFNSHMATQAKPFLLLLVTYLLAWLMNPTVNARYVMLITPVLVLLGLYMRNRSARGIA